MGASISQNITTVATEAIAKVSNNIIQNIQLTTDQTQIISVSDVDGDVVISGNTFTQKANLNMQSLMKALVQEDIQQALVMEIAQAAKSVVSGLNLFQYADAQNNINLLLKASAELMNTISNSCISSMSQNEVITVSRVKGNVYIQNNLFEQIADIVGSCVQDAVSQNKILQDLEAKIDQSSSSEAEGLSLIQIIILVLIILGVPAVSVIGGVAVVGKYIFPVSILIGAVCMVLYQTWVNETIFSHAFSPLIRYLKDCDFKLLTNTVTSFDTSRDAANACRSNPGCAAFDWQGAVIDDKGNHTSFTPPQTTFYSYVSDICEKTIKQSPDHSKVFRPPIFITGKGIPGQAKGDVYLDTTTSDYYYFDRDIRQWVKQGAFAHSDFTSRHSISWGTDLPSVQTEGIPGSVYVLYSPTNPIYFHVYVKNPDGWKLNDPSLKGPGLIPDTPDNINVSGFTTVQKKNWLLYFGGSLFTIGILGSVFAFKKQK
jgi:hypothetical protein